MGTIFWLGLGMVIAVLWLFYGTRTLCPKCGVDLIQSELDRFEYRSTGKLPERCRACGFEVRQG